MSRSLRHALPLAIVAAALLVPPAAHSAAGDLDVTFGGDGRVVTDVAGCADEAAPVVQDAAGKLVVGGYSCNPATPTHPLHATVWRYTSAGALDPTFSGDGVATVGFPEYESTFAALALAPGDTIVAAGRRAGETDGDALVTRWTSAGVPDATFGTAGATIVHAGPAGSYDEVRTVAVAGDGSVTAAGVSCTFEDFDKECSVFIAKLTSGGGLDTSYDGDGIALSPAGFDGDLAILSDGRVALSGSDPNDGTPIVALFTAAAQPDASFAGDGSLTPPISSFGLAASDTHLFAIGEDSDDTTDFAVAKYDLTGTPDGSWGVDGLAIADLGGEEYGLDGLVSGSTLYVLGEAAESDCCAVLARLLPDGTLDVGFGEGGSVRTAFGNVGTFVTAGGLTVQADGKPVVVGTVGDDEDLDVGLTRYLATTPNPVRYTPLTPVRILDSRPTQPFPGDGLNRRLNPGEEFVFKVTGKGGVPAGGVSAVVLNVTAISPTRSSYLSAYPFGAQFPVTSNLNFGAKQTVANLVTVKVGDDGKIVLRLAAGFVDVAVDVAGWYSDGTSPVTGGVFVPVEPARILDTRSGGGPIPGGGVRTVQITGAGGVPASGVSAVVLNLTVTLPTASAFVTAYPAGAALPGVSNVNFTPGQTVANMAVVKLGSGGAINIRNAAGTVHVVADVAGFFSEGTAYLGGAYQALTPNRILDTRYGIGTLAGPVGPGQTITVQVAGRGRVPAAAKAVVMNVTVVAPTASGYVKVWPADQASEPVVSAVNFPVGRTVPNLVTVKLSADGKVNLKNAFGSSHVLFDVAGWYSLAQLD